MITKEPRLPIINHSIKKFHRQYFIESSDQPCSLFVGRSVLEILDQLCGHGRDLRVRVVAERHHAAEDLGVDVAEAERRHRHGQQRAGVSRAGDPDARGRGQTIETRG